MSNSFLKLFILFALFTSSSFAAKWGSKTPELPSRELKHYGFSENLGVIQRC